MTSIWRWNSAAYACLKILRFLQSCAVSVQPWWLCAFVSQDCHNVNASSHACGRIQSPEAAAACAAKTHSSAYNCVAGNVQPRGDFASVKIKWNVNIGTVNIDSPLFHNPFCICRTSTTPPTTPSVTPTRTAPALEAAALGKCCSKRTKLRMW